MCGIAGIFDTVGTRTPDRALLQSMGDVIAHRGPDGEGFRVEPGVGLVHRRLSIIDLEGGWQPIENEDGTVMVVFNGEIYDYEPLIRELQGLGHTFRTRCDTEVIVHGYEEWGPDVVHRLNGMFAFAIYDRRQGGSLFLARDRLGIKPLHLAHLPDGQLLFASEMKSLLVHPQLSRELDPQAVEDYFTYGYVPDPKSILRSVRKLLPGHRILVRRGQPLPAPEMFWDIPFKPLDSMDDQEAGNELIRRIEGAVKRRLVAEVPLGAFLSGGVDSSAVVATMSRITSDPVRTCSISFDVAEFDEARYAAQVAEMYGTRHRVKRVATNDLDLVDRLAELYDEPFADSSAIPTYRVCQLAREEVTVALSGDGGDEAVAGYRRYRRHLDEERQRKRWPAGIRRSALRGLGSFYPRLRWAPRYLRAKGTFQMLGRDGVEGYAAIQSVLQEDLRRSLFSARFQRELAGYRGASVLTSFADQAPTDDPLSLIQYLDMKTYLVGDILTKVDRASMAHALEVRVPLLDYTLLEWVSGLPNDRKIRGNEGKWLLKKAFEPHLPQEILYRKKQGFAVPLAAWFRGPLRDRAEAMARGGPLLETGWFNPGTLGRLVDEHVRNRQDHSAALWSLLMFEAFLRRVLARDPTPAIAAS